jgi:hypothetical protein
MAEFAPKASDGMAEFAPKASDGMAEFAPMASDGMAEFTPSAGDETSAEACRFAIWAQRQSHPNVHSPMITPTTGKKATANRPSSFFHSLLHGAGMREYMEMAIHRERRSDI